MQKLHTRLAGRLAAVLLVAATGCVADGPIGALAPLRPGVPANGRYIVVLDPSARPSVVANAAGVRAHFVYSHALRGFAAPIPSHAMAFLRSDPRVLFIEPDRVAHAYPQTLPSGVDRVDADRNGVASIDGVDDRVDVDVAVIDTGIDLTHPDLNASSDRAVDCTQGTSLRPRCEAGGSDDNGHGTHVAGTIGALDDDRDVVGVAPGARVWSVKVLDATGTGYWSQILAGIDWITARADVIEVANMSLGSTGSDAGGCGGSSLHMAICNSVAAGVVYVVAAGNEADDAANHVPAAYDEVITVSALADFDGIPGGLGSATCRADQDDSFASFSNYGRDVDLMAPGVCIRSTRLGGGTTIYSGTSMAAPHVAGAAALHVAAHGRDLDGDGDHDARDVAAVRAALIAAGDPEPCASGRCADDPDGTQEPLVDVGTGCVLAADCDDSNACTIDSCVAGVCRNLAIADDTACAGGLCCAGTCRASACSADAGCDDRDECTTDRCASPGTCAARCDHIAAADGTACAGGAALCCAGRCASPACTTSADCDDGQPCTTDSCASGGTCGATCRSVWPPCGGADGCCGPSCGASDPDCSTSACGDAVCEGGGEDCRSCAADCRCTGRNCAKGCCGDGVCTRRESASNCPADCA